MLFAGGLALSFAWWIAYALTEGFGTEVSGYLRLLGYVLFFAGGPIWPLMYVFLYLRDRSQKKEQASMPSGEYSSLLAKRMRKLLYVFGVSGMAVLIVFIGMYALSR
jgi:hypothetical protein